jgi:1,4-dihydroxy-2-naphthoyl-CoA hydrolase
MTSDQNNLTTLEMQELAEAAHKMTVHSLLDIKIEKFSKDEVIFSMPVTWKVHQPAGLLHGGVSCVLAEGAASFGAVLNANPGDYVVGIEINASHLKAVKDGVVTAVATPIRVGKRVQVWNVDITNEKGELVCKSRVSLAVIPNNSYQNQT